PVPQQRCSVKPEGTWDCSSLSTARCMCGSSASGPTLSVIQRTTAASTTDYSLGEWTASPYSNDSETVVNAPPLASVISATACSPLIVGKTLTARVPAWAFTTASTTVCSDFLALVMAAR